MRVLIVVTPISSHLLPLVPLAWALAGAGHEVICAGEPGAVEVARAAGLHTVDIEAEPLPADAPPPAPARRTGGAPAAAWEPDWEALAVRWRFRVGRVIDGYLRFAREWRPHLVLSDPVEFCGTIVAGALGVPSVVHRWGTDVLTTLARGPARAALRSVCERVGTPGGLLPDPDLLLDPCPPLLRHPRAAPARPVRFVPYNGPGSYPVRGPMASPERRTICVSFSSRTIDKSGTATLAATARAFDGLEGVRGVFTLSRARAEELAPLPGNVQVIEPTPLSQLLTRCTALIHHGGSGTGLTALRHGLPQLVLAPPLPSLGVYAERIEACGAGRSLDPGEQLDPEAIRTALREVLDDRSYRAAAGRVRDEMAAMPAPSEVVAELEELAGARPAPARAAAPRAA
ncbi:nucleotide disphospho-sugar-binding domain-containing protein [Streptomyces sp. NPDC020480]|uniref:nucleotide disphospho-sugar-binding domain-containing protein n=1 Tax=Streptomyces sp. NPDC020480 TaxID=3365076 RepID=UPI0037B0709A